MRSRALRGSEDHKHRTDRITLDRKRREPILRVKKGHDLPFAGVGMPQLRDLASHAEGAIGVDRPLLLIGDKIDVRFLIVCLCILAVDEEQVTLRSGEIWLDSERFLQRGAPDDFARAVGMFRDALAVAIAPDLVGQFGEFLIHAGITAEARRAERFRSVDNRPVVNELRDFFKHRQGHPVLLRKHQHAVTHPAGAGDSAVLCLHQVQQGVGVADIVIVALGHRWPELRVTEVDGRSLAVEVAEVGAEAALLEQRLATREIIDPGGTLVPPGVRPLQVDPPRPHGHAGLSIKPRLVGVAVENEQVDPVAELQIPQCLERVGIVLPCGDIGCGGEGLACGNILTVNMSGRSGFLGVIDQNTFPEDGSLDPKLSHRHIAVFLAEKRVGHCPPALSRCL